MAITETIKSDGQTLQLGTYELISIDTNKEFNKIPTAEVKLYDGSVAKQEFKTLNDNAFLPGSKIEIFLKKEGELATEEKVFEGIVVNQGLERSMDRSILTIELYDMSLKMTALRSSTIYKNETDKEIIKGLVEKHELKVGEIDKTTTRHAQMVQYYVSDWDFMLSRAEANGQLVVANDGEIEVVSPKIQDPFLTLKFGIDLYDFDLKFNGQDQYKEVVAFGLDIKVNAIKKGEKEQKDKELTFTNPKKGNEYKLDTIGYNDISNIASVIGAEQAQIVHAAPLQSSELQAWSDAQIIKSRLSLIQGAIKISGNGTIKVGQTLKMENVSRFNGSHIISGVRQVYTKNKGWYTYLQIGMDRAWFTSRTDMVDPQAAGLLPGVNGLHLGTVTGHKEDPNNQFFVLVSIPAFHKDSKPTEVSALYTSLDAGANHGIFFPPQIGDRVVLGFLNDDPRQAIILGAMHSYKLPNTVKEKNKYRGIFTKSNYKLLFDEETQMVILSTADENNEKENKICIDQKQKCINLEDAHGNKIELNKNGITITSIKDCQIKTDGNFSIEAKGNVKIKGKKVDLL
ncbi:type VI secretion system tip protein VgrG [Flavobacterium jejuense]|uniref:Type VI secretion system tip protein VgrG n=1 Tax=Flavobacterium jejuense TaxID=1544455 RepID=A0ABX0IM67_9FLAO|nr:type VI secretion system tip protein VgrG [Flavobacterium jejuense]NHN24072.1 type VI secretion system tip protein VgrG [Flavobacterium jejuense]